MKFKKTLGGIAATLSLGLALVATPAGAVTPTPSSIVTVHAATTAKTAPNVAPKGYFAVAVNGSFRKGGVSNNVLLGAGKTSKNTNSGANMYTTKPFVTVASGYALKFGSSKSAYNLKSGLIFAKPASGKSVVVDVYYFKNSVKSAVLSKLEDWEQVCQGYNTKKPCNTWYKRTTVSASTLGAIGLPAQPAVMFVAGSGYKEKISGKECTVKDGNYFNRTKKGNGCF